MTDAGTASWNSQLLGAIVRDLVGEG